MEKNRRLFSLFCIVVCWVSLFTGCTSINKNNPVTPTSLRIINGPDGVNIKIQNSSIPSNTEFSIVKLNSSDIPSAPSWCDSIDLAYDINTSQPLQSSVMVELPIPSVDELVMFGHYNKSGFWEIVPFQIENGKMVANLSTLSPVAPLTTTKEKLVNVTAEKLVEWTIARTDVEPVSDEDIVFYTDPMNWVKGSAKKLANDEVELTLTNDAPTYRYFYPVAGQPVQLIQTSIFTIDQGVIIEPFKNATWRATIHKGDSVTFGFKFDMNSFICLLTDAIPGIKFGRWVGESIIFAKNGRALSDDEMKDIYSDILWKTAEKLSGKDLPDIDIVLNAWYSGEGVTWYMNEGRGTFSYPIRNEHVNNVNMSIGSTFCNLTFDTTESSKSELWIEANGKMNDVLDLSAKNLCTQHHIWEFGPLKPSTEYQYHVQVTGAGIDWNTKEEFNGTFTTHDFVPTSIGSGSDDVCAEPKVTMQESSPYMLYTVTIDFQTPDYSRCEVEYSGGFTYSYDFSTTGIMNSIMAKAETGSSLTHSITLDYVTPSVKFFYCIYDCRPADAQPWQEQTKKLIYYGTFET